MSTLFSFFKPLGKTTDKAGPSSKTPGKAGPSGKTPGKAGPSGKTPGKAGPSGKTPGKAGPSGKTPGKAGPSSKTPGKAGPSSKTPGKAGPSGKTPGKAGTSSKSPGICRDSKTPSRKRLIIDSESETETPVSLNHQKKKAKLFLSDDKDEPMELGERSKVTPKKRVAHSSKVTTPPTPLMPFTPKQAPRTLTPATPLTPHTSKSLALGNGPSSFFHDGLVWLKTDKLKDSTGRAVKDCEYDPKTLKIPDGFLNKLSPGQRQWWEVKRSHFDTIIMFKVGKFYELYHMDAVVGVRECGLLFMRGETAHCGFPEVGFTKYSQILIQKGYKVARVEQTETPAMMDKRLKKTSKTTKFDRVVRREVCSVSSKGTLVPGYQSREMTTAETLFLTSIKEEGSDYGVCFVDTSIGTFHLSQFTDDCQGSRLRTLIAHHPPAHVLFERARTSSRTTQIFQHVLASTIKDGLATKSEFWTSERTLNVLSEGDYFPGGTLPQTLDSMLDKDCGGALRACEGHRLAVSALGASVWYLKRCCVEHDLLSMNKFQVYTPLDEEKVEFTTDAASFVGQRMILDDITLRNLDIVAHGKSGGSLFERIDQTVTPFGKRLLRQWMCTPLCDPVAIATRLDAVTDLVHLTPLRQEVKAVLKKLPDLERKIRKFHILGSSKRSKDHPDARAVIYDHAVYSKRKITDFIAVLEGFGSSLSVLKLFKSNLTSIKSPLLRRLVTLKDNGGDFPSLSEQLTYFKTSFNQSEAKKAGVIVPSPGVNTDYDKSLDEVSKVTNQLEKYLSTQKKRLGVNSLKFWGTGRNRFQLEVPEAICHRLPREYELKSQRKGFRRYWTPEIERLLKELTDWEGERDSALKDNMRCLFNSFDQHFDLWQSSVECLSVLDVFISLASYSSNTGMCCPEVVPPRHGNVPFLEVVEGVHPCVRHTYLGDEFIPNDMIVTDKLCVVITGPNMGGKSTLMRQTALLIILAQMGCYVPAAKCSFSPVDRIFTRLGASDKITSGESTFFVELRETASILKHATCHSLILLDELGRGTSTYDGTAIASAVVTSLSEDLCCRTFFSTHYHSLVEELSENPRIKMGHMACLVEEKDNGEEIITFLYKFVDGACPKSYGFNVALMAGLSGDVVSHARVKAQEFETAAQQLQVFRKMFSKTFDNEQLSSLL